MALKMIMLKRSVEKKTEELKNLREKEKEFAKRETELEKAIAEVETEDDEKAVNEEIEKFEEEKTALEDEINKLEEEKTALEDEIAELEKKVPEPENRTGKKIFERRTAMEKIKIDVRSIPKSIKIFDAISDNERTAIMQRDDVKGFIENLKQACRNKRDITGGELTIPVIFLDLIAQNMYRYSKLIDRVRTRNVSGQARQTVAGTVPEAVWTEMCGAINELTFTFNQITLDGYKVAGFVPVCNSILEDSEIDVASWVIEMLSEAIGIAVDKAILYGKGATSKMPLGIVTRLAQSSQPDGYPATAPKWENLSTTNVIRIADNLKGADFWAQLTIATGNAYTKYARGELFWAMNSKTYALLKSKAITFTATGDVAANVYGVLPIITGNIDILEFIPDGDIIGGYGDLYLFAVRGGMTIEQSREVQFIQDNTVFKGKMRADGMPVIAGAFVAINIKGTQPTTVLTFAADTANEASLDGLKVGSYSLSPAFSPDTTTYAVTATNTSDSVEATPTSASAEIAISYNGKNVKDTSTVTWVTGTKPLTVTVKNGNSTMVYTVNVTKE